MQKMISKVILVIFWTIWRCWRRGTAVRTMSYQLQYNTGTSPFRPIQSHGTARRNRGGAELSCVMEWGGDSKGRFNPVTSRFDFRSQTLNYLKKKSIFPRTAYPFIYIRDQ